MEARRMTPVEFAGWVSGITALLAGVLKIAQSVGQAIGGTMASKATERRADLRFIIERQDAEIAQLKVDLGSAQVNAREWVAATERKCEDRIKAIETRFAESETKVEIMERVLYGMGYRQGDDGDWNPPQGRHRG